MSKKKKWKVGDVVELKSGGPAMTVCSTDLEGEVECNWFSDESHIHSDTFTPPELKEVSEEALARWRKR